MANNTVSRKSLADIIAYAFTEGCTVYDACEALNYDSAAAKAAAEGWHAAAHRPKKSKPSAETLANRENTALLVAELNARDGEFTAAEVADMTTDHEGNAMNPRKVGNLLARAAKAGMIDVSPEPWSVKHYARKGYEFAPKPKRKNAKKSEDTEE